MSTENLNDKIAQRAYEIYLERGGVHGSDFDDWVVAEQEIKGKIAKTATPGGKPVAVTSVAKPAVVVAAKPVASPAKVAPAAKKPAITNNIKKR
jgi:hypothetical protein